MSSPDFSSPGYKRSRLSYLFQCDFEYLVTLTVIDAYLAKLLGYLGIDDATTGIISSFISFAFLIQLFTLLLTRARVNAKKTVTVFETVSQLLFTGLYVIPFLPLGKTQVRLAVMACILVAYCTQYLIVNITYRWGNSFVEPRKRASYSAVKEMVSLLSGIVYTAVVGFFFDRFEASGNIKGGFILIAVLMFLCSMANLVTLLLIKNEDVPEQTAIKKSMRDIFSHTVGNRDFRPVILLQILYCVAIYSTTGFLGTFKINDLCYTVFTVQLITIAGQLARVFVSKPIGRFSDRYSFAAGMKLGLSLICAAFLCIVFTTGKTRWLIIVYTILYNCAMAGISANSSNIAYSYIDKDYVAEAMCIKNSIGGLCGFLASLLCSRVVSYIQGSGNMLFGFHVYAQQILACISLLFAVSAWLLIHLVIQRQKVTVQ